MFGPSDLLSDTYTGTFTVTHARTHAHSRKHIHTHAGTCASERATLIPRDVKVLNKESLVPLSGKTTTKDVQDEIDVGENERKEMTFSHPGLVYTSCSLKCNVLASFPFT